MSEEPRKRSRFDQTDEEPVKRSRFDQRDDRSRSPPKSPAVSKSIEKTEDDKKHDPVAAAMAAASRINAQLADRKGVQHVDVPPIRATSAGAPKSPSEPVAALNAEIYQQDGDFIKDIEVNDLRNRYTLTKGSTQKMIKDETGADVTTRGSYFPDKSMATAANPPLYLHVTSTTKDGLEKAVKKIDELMQQELPQLIDERRFRRREDQPREQPERDALGRRKWPDERIPIDLEPIPGFNLRAKVVGAGGSYVKHIQTETRCRVQIKGRGSGFMEHDTGVESDEQMYLHVAGPEQSMVDQAKEMCLSLLESVRESYLEFKERGPQHRGGGDRGGYGGGYGGDRGGYHNRDGGDRYGGAQSPVAPQAAATGAAGAATDPNDPAVIQAWITYYAANPSQDPMAQYGGYAAYMTAYLAAQAAGTTQSPAVANGSAPPPPPPEDQSAPPPPPPGTGGGAYNSVPPPPGV
ncbi:uncharacterized protein MYCGRDRAFT_77359 [Zymoseptoria tritici IPO323]|uniref:K Homology domain-containing protein n=1 Tax=Zymoseptoria tritici (strain CBS 115943 / IPO323) TaxID=336722 RepID=F9XNL7_ZYMTI|nr:uncharacterized protein MYCGRDRAFT_77359 [Zymoseptoria tritici IPO323]EGP83146.1 hypothetical protein MYCGRDRAFT_77359 [Zymoseptoria tritici IPO323]